MDRIDTIDREVEELRDIAIFFPLASDSDGWMIYYNNNTRHHMNLGMPYATRLQSPTQQDKESFHRTLTDAVYPFLVHVQIRYAP